MADKKISQLTSATTPLAGTEVLPIVQSSTTVKVAVSDLTAGRAVSASSLTLSSGTANGVLYLNGSNVATSGTSLVFDGTNFGVGNSAPSQKISINGGAQIYSSATLSASIGGSTVISYENPVTRQYIGDGTGYSWALSKRVTSTTTDLVTVTDAGNVTSTGTVSAPKFIPTGGTATGNGLYLPAANTLAFSTNGAEQMRLSATGGLNVGATTDPGAGAIRATGANGWSAISDGTFSTSRADGMYLIQQANAVMVLYTNNTERVRITSAGDVGIGTTAPAQKLQVNGGLYVAAAATLSASGTAGTFSYEHPVLRQYVGDGTGYSLAFSKRASSTTTDLITITDAGNVTVSSGSLLLTGASGLGYGTGSGGAVTQATSRTTGVTLNKSNGAITLVSAAGTTTWQSFTVTNSVVAATDTIIVNQKSGTDLYQIFVTNVAAGSFKITFATTGGTTTEQPVFNFAVIKAVTS